MPRPRHSQTGAPVGAARKRNLPRRPPSTATVQFEDGEVPAQVRAPNRPDWADPLNEEELRALAAGWGFVE